uniref:lymphocyte antigen 6 complex locus protein G6c-like n=1 Tax=Pristiophorus japonicus TaxID=55135 RepID=UPI00398E702F
MKLLFLAAVLTYLVVPGTGLKCFQCGISTSLCIFSTTCDANEMCFSRNTTAGSIKVYSSGCTNTENCGKQVTDTLATVSYTYTTVCCNVDYCNGAAAVKLSLLTGSVMALVWMMGYL